MNSYQKSNMLKMIKAYNFIAENPGCSVWDLCDGMNITQKTARRLLRALHSDGYTSLKVGFRSQSGQHPNAYSITAKECPSLPPVLPSGRPATHKPVVAATPRAIPECKRVIKKATQIGMAPYADLPAGFFRCQVEA